MRSPGGQTLWLTSGALLAFAGNSLLARQALGPGAIDAASFTAIRLGAGALVLAALLRARAGSWSLLRPRGAAGPLALLAYAAAFSWSYLRIGAGVGALVLFGCVQLTMIGHGLARGERPGALAWLGITLATAGLAVLAAPAATSPDPVGCALMALAGVAWGVYSLLGRTAGEPIAANARAFLWSTPLALAVVLVLPGAPRANTTGIVLAATSGALTSALGYAVWYRVLPQLSATRAAVVQLGVPVVAALGAVALLDEPMTWRLAGAGVLVLGGVALVFAARGRPTRR